MELNDNYLASWPALFGALPCFLTFLRPCLFYGGFTCTRVFALELVELFGIEALLMNLYS